MDATFRRSDMKKDLGTRQELIVAAVAGINGLVMISLTWSQVYAIAKDSPAVGLFLLGQGLVFMACGMLVSAHWKRAWIRAMANMPQNHFDNETTE
jgi:hypothetical protein